MNNRKRQISKAIRERIRAEHNTMTEKLLAYIKEFFAEEDLLTQIFEVLCYNTDCEKCQYLNTCYSKSSLEGLAFETKSEQEKLKICAAMERQFDKVKYE